MDISERKVVRNKTGHRRITSVAATAVHRRNDGRNRVFVREVCERRSFVGIRISIRRLADIASTLVACFGVYVGVGITHRPRPKIRVDAHVVHTAAARQHRSRELQGDCDRGLRTRAGVLKKAKPKLVLFRTGTGHHAQKGLYLSKSAIPISQTVIHSPARSHEKCTTLRTTVRVPTNNIIG